MPNFHLYFDNETFAKFSEVASKDYHENINQVEWVSVDKGYILPAKKTQNSAYAGGVTDQNKLFVPLSKYERVGGGSLTEAYDFDEKNVVSKDIDVLYAGMIINHFGHFLVEGTSRLWYYIENKDKKMDIAFLMPKNQKIFPQFWEFMALLGIEKKHVHFIKKITRFRKIYVPMQSHVFTSTYNEKFLTFFKGMRDQVLSESSNLKTKEKVYLSRRKFKTGTQNRYALFG
ncbi:MAG: glycosyltransferase family 61 protein [Alphaproteobacteria bacterium]|nr:glycosyltransferase family 61 protein [Alphaproteobacteria bacterium]